MTNNSIRNLINNSNSFFTRTDDKQIQICLYNQAYPEDLFEKGGSKEEKCLNAIVGALIRESFYINKRGSWGVNYDTPWVKKKDLIKAVKTLRRKTDWMNKIEELSHSSMEVIYNF